MNTFNRLAIAVAALAGCGDTGQKIVSYPWYSAGAGGEITAGNWRVTLDRAQLAIGPMYFCATEAASMSLCPSAVNEFADVALVDALAAGPTEMGQIRGQTGEIRSVTYDLGIHWFTRQSSPTPAPVAPGGHSAHFEGHADDGARSFRFVADVDLPPSHAGTLAVQGTRVGPIAVGDSGLRLDVQLDPRRWWQGADFDELAAIGGDPVVVPRSSRSYGAVTTAITVGTAPRFEWTPN